MNRYVVVVLVSFVVVACIFLYTPFGLIGTFIATITASLITEKTQDPVLFCILLFFLTASIVSIVALVIIRYKFYKQRRDRKKKLISVLLIVAISFCFFSCSKEPDAIPESQIMVSLGNNYELKFQVFNSWGMAEVNFYEKGFYCPPALIKVIYYDKENQKHELLGPSADGWQVWEQRFLDLRSKLQR